MCMCVTERCCSPGFSDPQELITGFWVTDAARVQQPPADEDSAHRKRRDRLLMQQVRRYRDLTTVV